MKKSENRNLSSDKPRLPEIPYFLYFFDILFFDFYFQDYCLDVKSIHGFDYYKTQSVKYYHCLSGAMLH